MSKPELMSLIPSPWGYIVTEAQEIHARLEKNFQVINHVGCIMGLSPICGFNFLTKDY